MAIKDWNGFKKSGDTYIPNDATARAGVTTTVDLLKDTTGWLGGNELELNMLTTKAIWNGVTLEPIENSVHVYGTASGVSAYNIAYFDPIPNKEYVLIGTPTNAPNKCFLRAHDGASTYEWQAIDVNGTGVTIKRTNSNRFWVDIRIENGETVDLLFKPMIIDAKLFALNPSYRPYHESVEEYAFPRSEQAVLGAKNIITIDGTSSGIFTINSDKTVTVNGNGGSEIVLSTYKAIPSWLGNCYLSGGKSADKRLVIGFRNASDTWLGDIDNTSGDTAITIPANAAKYQIKLVIGSGITLDNEVFYPMLSFDGGEYAPAMTNRELTEKVTVKSDSITSSFTANGDVANGLKKIGEIVFIDAAYKEVTASQWDVIATIPVGFRPKTPCRLLDGFGKKSLVINANGDIQAAESISNTYVYIHGSWVVS